MIGIHKEQINNIPALVIVDNDAVYKALPMITYFHGFTSAKEHNLPLAYLLAENGFRVILPDSAHHGERSEGKTVAEMQLLFWDIVKQNVEDLQFIHDKYRSEKLLADGRFGVAGTSMGGITTAAVLAQYDWVRSAAILMGSPKLERYARELVEEISKQKTLPFTEKEIEYVFAQLEPYDLSRHIGQLDERPLLFWHGKKDDVVPYAHSYDFYLEAKKVYENKENIKFISEENQSHKVSRYAILNTIEWFSRHLMP